MDSMLTISKPVLDGDFYTMSVAFQIASQPVVIILRLAKGLGDAVFAKIGKYVSFGSCGQGQYFGGEHFGPFWGNMSDVVSGIGQAASNRAVFGAVTQHPYAAHIVSDANSKALAHHVAKSPYGGPYVQRIYVDANSGVPEAQDALAQLQAVEQLNQIRVLANQGYQPATMYMSLLQNAANNGYAGAAEAVAIVDALNRLEAGLAPADAEPIVVQHDYTGEDGAVSIGRDISQRIAAGARAISHPSAVISLRSSLRDAVSRMPQHPSFGGYLTPMWALNMAAGRSGCGCRA